MLIVAILPGKGDLLSSNTVLRTILRILLKVIDWATTLVGHGCKSTTMSTMPMGGPGPSPKKSKW